MSESSSGVFLIRGSLASYDLLWFHMIFRIIFLFCEEYLWNFEEGFHRISILLSDKHFHNINYAMQKHKPFWQQYLVSSSISSLDVLNFSLLSSCTSLINLSDLLNLGDTIFKIRPPGPSSSRLWCLSFRGSWINSRIFPPSEVKMSRKEAR